MFNQKEYFKEWVKNNSEKMKEYNKKYSLNNKEKIREKNKKWVEKNKEYMVNYRNKNREKINRNIRKYKDYEWKKEIECLYCKKIFIPNVHNKKICSKECSILYYAFYYKSKNNGVGVGKYKLRFEIFKRDSFTCQYCGRNVVDDKIKLYVDHIKPVKKGGLWSIDNLITSCFECNLGKTDVLLSDKSYLSQKSKKLSNSRKDSKIL